MVQLIPSTPPEVLQQWLLQQDAQWRLLEDGLLVLRPDNDCIPRECNAEALNLEYGDTKAWLRSLLVLKKLTLMSEHRKARVDRSAALSAFWSLWQLQPAEVTTAESALVAWYVVVQPKMLYLMRLLLLQPLQCPWMALWVLHPRFGLPLEVLIHPVCSQAFLTAPRLMVRRAKQTTHKLTMMSAVNWLDGVCKHWLLSNLLSLPSDGLLSDALVRNGLHCLGIKSLGALEAISLILADSLPRALRELREQSWRFLPLALIDNPMERSGQVVCIFVNNRPIHTIFQ